MDNSLKTYNVKSLHLEITGKCNLNCVYCYNSQFNEEKKINEEMSTDTVKKLIDDAKNMGCKSFTFSGGDPFMRDDIFEILDHCHDVKVHILTNGKLMDKNLADKLVNYNQIGEIKITLDGLESHDLTRIGSDYKQVIDAIRLLKDRGFKVVINTEVTYKNLPEMPELYNLLKNLKVNRWRVDLPFIIGRYKENYLDFKLPNFKDFILIFKDILQDYIKQKPTFELELFNVFKSEITAANLMEFTLGTHPCDYRTGSFPLRPNGDMVFCPSMDVPMSNFVKEGSLKKAIEKKYKHDFYDIKIANIKECQECKYLKLCGTGCRVDSLYYLGEFLKPDPINCNLMPLIEEEIIPILPDDLRAAMLYLIDPNKKSPTKFDIDKLVEQIKL